MENDNQQTQQDVFDWFPSLETPEPEPEENVTPLVDRALADGVISQEDARCIDVFLNAPDNSPTRVTERDPVMDHVMTRGCTALMYVLDKYTYNC